MKTAFVFLAVFSCGVVWAQLPVRNTSLTLDAKSVSSGGSTVVQHSGGPSTVNVTGFGAVSAPSAQSTQTHESKTRIEVDMRNLGTSPASARLEWYFVGRKLQGRSSAGSQFIWDSGRRDVSVTPGAEDKEFLESSALAQTLTQTSTGSGSYVSNGQLMSTIGSAAAFRSGAKPAGWIVRLMDGDQVLRIQASSGDLEVLGRDTTRLNQLLQAGPPPTPVPPFGIRPPIPVR